MFELGFKTCQRGWGSGFCIPSWVLGWKAHEDAEERAELENKCLSRCLLKLRETRLLPIKWVDQTIDERRALLLAFVLPQTLPAEVSALIGALCHIEDGTVSVVAEDDGHEVY